MTIDKELIYKAGFVAIVGRPNVGKSTLVNAFMHQKVAAVSPKPQTTRQQQLGILTLEDAQIIFIDTPGYHHHKHKLGKRMNDEVIKSLEDVDFYMIVVDSSQFPPHEEDILMSELIANQDDNVKSCLVLNKTDKIPTKNSEEVFSTYSTLFPELTSFKVSAARGDGLMELLNYVKSALPENPPYYPDEQITDVYERDIAADLIRAACLVHLRDEVPHAIAVRIDEYTERDSKGAYIQATLFVERDSQKGIVIGKQGKTMKTIGSHARADIEKMSGRKVYLKLRVKVRKNWRNNEKVLSLFGFHSKGK